MYRILPTVPSREWREPSRAQPKDQFGNQNRTRFRLTARLNDGAIRWRGWFDSREDADAFLWAIGHCIAFGDPVPVEIWHLPTPAWHPDIGPFVTYDFATLTFLSTAAGVVTNYTSASDWNSFNNFVDALAGGGSSGAGDNTTLQVSVTGGGGGEWRRLTNFFFASPGASTAQYQVGGETSVNIIGAGSSIVLSGSVGNSTWWNGASAGAATLSAVPGGGGAASHTQARAGGAGGSGGTGGTAFAGGAGGAISGNLTSRVATGGGGAGGPAGAGTAGVSRTTDADFGSNGGAANGGALGGAGSGASAGNGGEAPRVAAWGDINYAISGGGGGGWRSGSAATGGDPTLGYGGSGGAAVGKGATSGRGAQGIIVLSYSPNLEAKWGMFFGGGV